MAEEEECCVGQPEEDVPQECCDHESEPPASQPEPEPQAAPVEESKPPETKKSSEGQGGAPQWQPGASEVKKTEDVPEEKPCAGTVKAMRAAFGKQKEEQKKPVRKTRKDE